MDEGIWKYVAGLITVLLFLSQFYQSRTSAGFDKRLSLLEFKYDLFSKAIEKNIGETVHSPHREELDRLIEKNSDPDQELTREEAIRLVQLLDGTLHDPQIRPGEEVGIKLFKSSLISRFLLTELV